MNDSKISVRYARALFQSAIEKDILDKVNDNMLLIAELCKIPEVKELLHSPVIVPSKKSTFFHKVLEGNVEMITLSLIDLAVQNGREKYIPAISRNFIHDTLKYKGITETVLTTAVKVDEKIKGKISKMVADVFGTKVDLRENVDPEIIGGFILRVNDSYIDGSVRKKLRTIRKSLKGSVLTD